MDKPWEIICDKCLVVSDFHQNVAWMKAILEEEKNNFDRLVFAGDAFDTHCGPGEVAGIKETAEFYKELINNYNVLAGNHELGYMESWAANQKHSNKHQLFNACSGFTNSKSKEINKILTYEDWRKVKLFYVVNGWFVSHAGLHSNFWPIFRSEERNTTDNVLHRLYDKCDDTLRRASFGPTELLGHGYSRGGNQLYGGLTWQDLSEFDDGIPLPQVFGHSHDKTVRKKGNSFCIDDGHSYVLISRDGSIQIKSIEYLKGIDGVGARWIQRIPIVEEITLTN